MFDFANNLRIELYPLIKLNKPSKPIKKEKTSTTANNFR